MICYRQLNDALARAQYLNYLKKELFRKSIHICAAFTPFFLCYFYKITMFLLFFAIVCYSICEALRLKGINVPLISQITALAARKRDADMFVLGPVTLALGVMLCAYFFHNAPVPMTCGIFALSFGDGLASLAGKTFGRLEIPFTTGKTVAGSLTCFVSIYLSSFLVCQNASASLVCAVSGMIIEMLPLKDFDNIIIPVLVSCNAIFVLP